MGRNADQRRQLPAPIVENHFTADNRFAIGFFRDAAWQQFIHMEYGYWAADNGKRVLKTDGVKDAEIYEYKVIDADTVSYVSTAWDATADCQEHYTFTEHRMIVRKKAASTPATEPQRINND